MDSHGAHHHWSTQPILGRGVLLCTAPSSAEGWKPLGWCLCHLLFVLFELLFAFIFCFLFSILLCLGFVPRCMPILLFFSCLFCSFSSHPSDKPVLSLLSAPASSSCLWCFPSATPPCQSCPFPSCCPRAHSKILFAIPGERQRAPTALAQTLGLRAADSPGFLPSSLPKPQARHAKHQADLAVSATSPPFPLSLRFSPAPQALLSLHLSLDFCCPRHKCHPRAEG